MQNEKFIKQKFKCDQARQVVRLKEQLIFFIYFFLFRGFHQRSI